MVLQLFQVQFERCVGESRRNGDRVGAFQQLADVRPEGDQNDGSSGGLRLSRHSTNNALPLNLSRPVIFSQLKQKY